MERGEEGDRIVGLLDVIELVNETAPPVVHEAHEIRVHVSRALREAGERPQQNQVDSDALSHVGTLNLDSYLDGGLVTLGAQRALVHLAERRGRDGFGREPFEERIHLAGLAQPPLRGHGGARLGRRKGWHAILQSRKGRNVRGRQQVGTD